MKQTLRRVQRIPAPLDDVFAFFSEASNLATMTPSWLGFRILTPQPIEMRDGTLIDYRIAFVGVPMRWRTLISRWEPPHVFVDEQLRGPYQKWIHTHRFEQQNGEVMMTDTVNYALGFGPLGDIVHRALVRRSLAAIFDHRARTIIEHFGPAPAR